MNQLRYKITAISKAAAKRVHIFTVAGDPELAPEFGVARAKREAKERGLDGDFDAFRAELEVDTTRHYKTRSGKKVTIHEVVNHNSLGEEVTFPIKCSIRADKPRARSRYAILTSAGLQGGIGHEPRPDDIVGYWE